MGAWRNTRFIRSLSSVKRYRARFSYYSLFGGEPRACMAEKRSRSPLPAQRQIHVHNRQQEAQLLQSAKNVIPSLEETFHKGVAGRIGVIGGCQEYTGAPYFAAISALKTGADLSHVFCTSDSASVIKSYSPELIVHPLLDRTFAVNEISEWLSRLHCLVVGPGLGRNPTNLENAKRTIEKARKNKKHLVIDADGIAVVTTYPEIIKNYDSKKSKVILTPNVVEFDRLYTSVMGKAADPHGDSYEQARSLSQELGNVTICRKGQHDIITDGQTVVECSITGSNRRCGGQGDLLSGSMAVFLHWANIEVTQNPALVAAYAASGLTRWCNRLAYSRLKRSMTTSDMIQQIHQAFEELFGKE
ncbi:predicted protein [Nematostella vectensis]|uniref:ATP-dependent (S)-NAD(P)H-hydrate dehydratase n=1 Tax=Nematostella vectensis TaxID=45351 RepID=NNRD_NEMVE|nr:RecName: Full=ATP-dependent (S)-NAD(P)H-hydrate dehydratase; AltName: Full=ATP-dependent NAD(P)HX dehydratase [Nematostella vectensis]EDO45663.1 predicted protein [Nematostella vectensis]|eukprot:XP_001637726.1 predicted protein [Nematostella vectensis]